jgi:hypothetical protein
VFYVLIWNCPTDDDQEYGGKRSRERGEEEFSRSVKNISKRPFSFSCVRSREREKQMLIELCGVPRRKKNYKNVNHVDSDGRLSNSTPGGFPLFFPFLSVLPPQHFRVI